MRRSLLVLFPLLLLLAACTKKTPTDTAPSPAPSSEATTVPPIAPIASLSEFLEASSPDGKTPYEQALAYEANGQLWLGHLVLEKKALGADGTKEEVELLARICHAQGEEACVEECSRKLGGKKLKFDASAPPISAPSSSSAIPKEPDNDVARARQLLLEGKTKEARKILEPKMLDGKASTEEVRMLKAICKQEGDSMCIALCDTKLK